MSEIKQENLLRISGTAYLEEALEEDREYEMLTKITVKGVNRRSKQNDEKPTQTWVAGITSNVELINGKKVIFGKDRQRKSVALRGAIHYLQQEVMEGAQYDSSAFYEIFMDKIIRNVDKIWEIVKKI